MVTISKIAWEKGTVLSTCQGCSSTHTIADAAGRLDLSNQTKFSNVVNSVPGAVDLRGLNASAIAAIGADLGIGVDPLTGSTILVPRAGEKLVSNKTR